MAMRFPQYPSNDGHSVRADRQGDPKAAAIHRARAEKAYQDAERFRRLGLVKSQAAALAFARHEDETAELLERRAV